MGVKRMGDYQLFGRKMEGTKWKNCIVVDTVIQSDNIR